MCQRVSNTVNTVLYCNYRCVVDLVTSRGKKNNANIPKLHITKLLIDINQCCNELPNYSIIRIVFHEYFYSYSYLCHFEVPNII